MHVCPAVGEFRLANSSFQIAFRVDDRGGRRGGRVTRWSSSVCLRLPRSVENWPKSLCWTPQSAEKTKTKKKENDHIMAKEAMTTNAEIRVAESWLAAPV